MKQKKRKKNTKKFFRNKKNTAIVVAHIYVPSQKKSNKKPHNLKTMDLTSQGSKHHFFGPTRQEDPG